MEKKFISNELYDNKTLFTLSGASMGVWLFTAVLTNVFSINANSIKWVGLVVALFLAYIGAFNLYKKLNLKLATVAFFNGLLIFITASGIDSINHNIKTLDQSSTKIVSSLLPFTENQIWWTPKELPDSIIVLNEIVNTKELEISKLNIELQILKKENQSQYEEKESTKITSSNTVTAKFEQSELNDKVVNSKATNNKSDSPVSVGYKTFLENGKYGLVNNNDTLIKPIYDNIIPYKCDSVQFFIVSLNNMWGVLDDNSNLIIAIKQNTYEKTKTVLEASELLRKGKINKIGW
jgi:hypothetical protein